MASREGMMMQRLLLLLGLGLGAIWAEEAQELSGLALRCRHLIRPVPLPSLEDGVTPQPGHLIGALVW